MFISNMVLVFRTDVATLRLAKRICRQLQRSGLVLRATFDLEDCDRVLRVVTEKASKRDIERLVGGMGIEIQELF